VNKKLEGLPQVKDRNDRYELDDKVDRGEWEVYIGSSDPDKVYLSSSDFKHDVLLTVGGDFASKQHKMEYARLLAERLNAAIPPDESKVLQYLMESCRLLDAQYYGIERHEEESTERLLELWFSMTPEEQAEVETRIKRVGLQNIE
jgi:hypothetical protein